ncbi:MAG: hypothetical protein DMD95_15305 [Candidatus Rokuibacteriota bacterium]|nr:MAG: hypothetical protein DMD95_15305 [Candidatus Rokubacteria bacterium]
MIALVGATLIDGTGRPPGEAPTVIVDGNRVTSVGLARTTTVPPGATVIPARDKFLTPGLVDMHVHVHTPDRWHPELFLAAGVTTVLDLGGQLRDVAGYRAVVESGARPGPRILFTGPMLEEGEMYPGFAGFCRRFDATRTEAEVEVEHLNVFGQLAPEGFWLAEPAKLNPFEYGGWLWRWLGDLDPSSDAVRRLYDGLIDAGTALDPTLVLYAARPGAIGDDVGDASMDDPESTRLLPLLPPRVAKELVTRWSERRGAARGASEPAKHRMRRAWDNILALVGGFQRAGGMVLAGTDCPNVAIVSGFSLHRELELLVRAGLSPMEAIVAATRRPAERLGKRDVFGTIAPGRAADLLLLAADPLADIRNIRRIERVIAGGIVHEPGKLLEGLRSG